MIKHIQIKNETIRLKVRRSKKAKYLRISISRSGELVGTLPYFFSEKKLKNFLFEKEDWILKHLKKIKKRPQSIMEKGDRSDYLRNKKAALNLIKERLEIYNRHYGFEFKRISVKDQKTRWGSCSSLGNLNFNWRIVLLDLEFIDYLAVHELCHLKEMNHSRRFWLLVGETIENYKEIRKRLSAL